MAHRPYSKSQLKVRSFFCDQRPTFFEADEVRAAQAGPADRGAPAGRGAFAAGPPAQPPPLARREARRGGAPLSEA